MRTVAFCEQNDYCSRVLAKHWPDVPCYPDVRELTAEQLDRDGIEIDVICGGFPCQDISSAAHDPAGIDGDRSRLWEDFARLIGEIRPRAAIVENVSALRQRGISTVLGNLAQIGYDAEWHCIPASIVGAPHPRDRIWIVAYPAKVLRQRECGDQPSGILSRIRLLSILDNQGRGEPIPAWWASEPRVDRVVHGISNRVDRLGCLSNSLVPQIAEAIGIEIIASFA
jgi:DNA (cytosine-5)-methyltransferase 1